VAGIDFRKMDADNDAETPRAEKSHHNASTYSLASLDTDLDESSDAEGGVLCGVVWCCVVLYGVVWCGVVWCGVVWRCVVLYGVVLCGVVLYGVVLCGVVLYGVVLCG
jgi:hypothetical protein